MDAETKTALEASIRHWEDNVANWQGFIDRLLAGEVTRQALPIFKEHCALCGLFFDYECEGCPLDDAGYGCNHVESPWSNVLFSLAPLRTAGPNSINASHDAARNMLQALKDVNHD